MRRLTREEVYSWYKAYLLREPSPAEIDAWIEFHGRSTRFEVQARILASEEFFSVRADSDPNRYVELIYDLVLHRLPTQEERSRVGSGDPALRTSLALLVATETEALLPLVGHNLALANRLRSLSLGLIERYVDDLTEGHSVEANQCSTSGTKVLPGTPAVAPGRDLVSLSPQFEYTGVATLTNGRELVWLSTSVWGQRPERIGKVTDLITGETYDIPLLNGTVGSETFLYPGPYIDGTGLVVVTFVADVDMYYWRSATFYIHRFDFRWRQWQRLETSNHLRFGPAVPDPLYRSNARFLIADNLAFFSTADNQWFPGEPLAEASAIESHRRIALEKASANDSRWQHANDPPRRFVRDFDSSMTMIQSTGTGFYPQRLESFRYDLVTGTTEHAVVCELPNCPQGFPQLQWEKERKYGYHAGAYLFQGVGRKLFLFAGGRFREAPITGRLLATSPKGFHILQQDGTVVSYCP